MRVTCHNEKIAYVPTGFDDSGIVAGGYRVVEDPDQIGAHLVDAGCGRTFEIPDNTDDWDITTDASGNITERHRDVLCLFCGTVADHLSVPEPT